jgi:hypothetical protein
MKFASLAVGLALLVAGCGQPEEKRPDDPYFGAIDTTALDQRFLPSTDRKACANQPSCYPVQTGFAGGAKVGFYNFGAVQARNLPKVDNRISVTAELVSDVFVFEGQCAAGAGSYDPRVDPFPTNEQFPVFSALPVASTSTSVVTLPIVRLNPTKRVGGGTCNDVKTTASISIPGGDAVDDAKASASPGNEYAFWPVVAFGAPTMPLPNGKALQRKAGWFKGLQMSFLAGPGIALQEGKETFPTMMGALVHTPSTTLSRVTDTSAIVLQHPPGDPAFSPIVALYDFVMPAGKKMGSYTALCKTKGGPCAENEIDPGALPKDPANFLFIVTNVP